MVHVSIGNENRDLRDVAPAWLRSAVQRLRHSGAPVCVKIRITSGAIEMILATCDCPSGDAEDVRPFRGEEISISHNWQAKRLDAADFNVADLEDFLKRLRKLQS